MLIKGVSKMVMKILKLNCRNYDFEMVAEKYGTIDIHILAGKIIAQENKAIEALQKKLVNFNKKLDRAYNLANAMGLPINDMDLLEFIGE